MRAAFLLAIPGLTSCVAQELGATYRGEFCEVTVPVGWMPELARGIAIAADSVVVPVADKLSLPATPVVLNLLPQRFLDGKALMARFTTPPPRVELGSSCLEEAGRLESILAHEFVHKDVAQAGWAVPYVVQEVMAEFIARPIRGIPEEQVLSEAAPTTRAELEVLFDLSNEEVQARSEEERERMYRACLGFLRRVGWSNLLSMLHEGRSSRTELLAAFEAELEENIGVE